jgi:hypothetical protein
MNRKQRRVAKATARRQSVDPVVTIHEAGHAVACALTAELFGLTPEDAIHAIEVYPVGRPVPGGSILQGQALQKMMTKQMAEFMQQFLASNRDRQLVYGDLIPVFGEMRSAGIDLDAWFRARALQIVFGPMAEAKFTRKTFSTVFDAPACERDREDVVRDGLLCGLSTELISDEIDHAVATAEHNIERPEVWNAIEALAAKLKYGRMSGKEAAAIIAHATKTEGTI